MDDKISRRRLLGAASTAGFAAAAMSIAGKTSTAASVTSAASYKLLDIHHHVESTDDIFSDFTSPDEVIARDFDVRVPIMDANGIDQAILMVDPKYRKTNGIDSTRKVNDLIATYVAKHSDRFPIAFGTVEPMHGEASLRELERMANDLKMRGVYWHHGYCGIPIDHPSMHPIIQQVAKLHLIPFVHAAQPYNESFWRMEALAEDYPDMTFVALSDLTNAEAFDQGLRIAKRTKNILFDTGPLFWRGEANVESFVKKVGANRIIFGSDLYAKKPSYRRSFTVVEILNNSRISDQEKAQIFSGNARRLLGLPDNGAV